jgi:hypothetical protein
MAVVHASVAAASVSCPCYYTVFPAGLWQQLVAGLAELGFGLSAAELICC